MTAFIAIVLIVLLGVSLIVVLSGIAIYARVVKLRTAVTSSWSEIDNILKKRYGASSDLRRNTDFLRLQKELGVFEDVIAAAVSDYNAAVRDYNSGIETFPADLIAKRYNLKKAESFDMKLWFLRK